MKTEPEVDILGGIYKNRKAFCVEGIKFFQIGDATQYKFNYR